MEVLFKVFLAYDSIEEKISSSYRLGFTNGTEEYIRTIIDYKQVAHVIIINIIF